MALMTVVTALTAIAALALGVHLAVLSRRQANRILRAEAHCVDLTAQLKALTAGALGQCERVNRLEENLGRLRHRVDTVASQESGGGPAFAQAIRLARRGSSAEDLVEACGLSRMEADLVVTLHRSEDKLTKLHD